MCNFWGVWGVAYFIYGTHKAVLVRDVVGELELVEGDDLLHPLLAGGRAVRVDVHTLGHLRVSLACHHPPARKREKKQRVMIP